MTSVLIADDEPNIRLLVRASLRSEAYSVLEVEDGDAAWEVIRAHRCAVVLLDLQMPGKSGLEVARLVKGHPRLRDTYVIILTARADVEVVAACIAAGADLYLTKPFSPHELRDAVARALRIGPPGTVGRPHPGMRLDDATTNRDLEAGPPRAIVAPAPAAVAPRRAPLPG